jgi:hypothetical protein
MNSQKPDSEDSTSQYHSLAIILGIILIILYFTNITYEISFDKIYGFYQESRFQSILKVNIMVIFLSFIAYCFFDIKNSNVELELKKVYPIGLFIIPLIFLETDFLKWNPFITWAYIVAVSFIIHNITIKKYEIVKNPLYSFIMILYLLVLFISIIGIFFSAFMLEPFRDYKLGKIDLLKVLGLIFIILFVSKVLLSSISQSFSFNYENIKGIKRYKIKSDNDFIVIPLSAMLIVINFFILLFNFVFKIVLCLIKSTKYILEDLYFTAKDTLKILVKITPFYLIIFLILVFIRFSEKISYHVFKYLRSEHTLRSENIDCNSFFELILYSILGLFFVFMLIYLLYANLFLDEKKVKFSIVNSRFIRVVSLLLLYFTISGFLLVVYRISEKGFRYINSFGLYTVSYIGLAMLFLFFSKKYIQHK